MAYYSDDKHWQEGRNLKEERSRKVKSKRVKDKHIQRGIDAYFMSEANVLPDKNDDYDVPDDIYYS